jgi:signal transduction histidine kinase
VVGIGGSLFYSLALSPSDLDVLTGPITCVMIGSTLFFPWGGVSQLVVSGVMALGYTIFLWPQLPATGMRATNVALSVGLSAVLSLIGAVVLERSRQTAFVARRRVRGLAVQRRHMIEIGRNLRSTLSLDAIAERLMVHARGLIPADAVVLALRGPADGAYRIVSASGHPAVENLVGLIWEPHFAAAFGAAFAPAEVREWPGGPLDSLLTRPLEAMGLRSGLMSAVGPHPAPAGFLTWVRQEPAPFVRAHHLAAQGIADQAFTALSAAQLYEAAAQASRLKSQFVSTMSHELRTPLNVIIGYNQILREIMPPDPDTMRALEAIERGSRELLELIEATLDIGRLEAGRDDIQEEPVVVRDLFDELAREFTHVPRAAGVALIWDVESVGTIVVDRRKLKTVLKNLVGNALKFTPAGSVRVECRPVDERCRFRVIDTGIGIRQQDQMIIFDMFRQADSSDTRRYGGTGLGLYIVRQMLALLSGDIALESAIGSGSTFVVTLPRDGARDGGRAREAA